MLVSVRERTREIGTAVVGAKPSDILLYSLRGGPGLGIAGCRDLRVRTLGVCLFQRLTTVVPAYAVISVATCGVGTSLGSGRRARRRGSIRRRPALQSGAR